MLNFFVFIISVGVLLGTIYFPFPAYELIVLAALVLLGFWRYRIYTQTLHNSEHKLELLLAMQLHKKH